MKFLATDLLIERLERFCAARPALRDAYGRRLRSLRDGVNDGESKRLQGPGDFFESRLSDDLRLLWRRGRWRGDEAMFLYTIGGHDHVFDEARRISPGSFTEVEIVEAPAPAPAWRSMPEVAAGSEETECQRYWVLDEEGMPWELKLTDEQELLVDEPGPLLLTGAAGSGRTTLLAHRAARAAATCEGRLLFVTFHEELADFTRGALGRIHGGLYADRIDVLSFKSLCERLWAETIGGGVPWAAPESYRDRLNQLLVAEKIGHVPKAYVDAELRGALKGRWLADGSPPTLEAYRKGVRTDLAFLGDDDRVRLHAVFERLRRAMEAAGEVDTLDAARVLASQPTLPAWEHLFVDEAQDFTQVELTLLARLVPDPARWGIAADEMQVVYPSLFRWDRVRDVITAARARREEDPVRVEVHRIETNHRNPAPILALAQAVLDWRTRLCGSEPSAPSVPRAPGTVVPRVTAHPSGVLPYREVAAIAQRVPLTAVLCPTQALADEVREGVRAHAPLFTRALDFASAKGLEFDVVVVWHPFEGPDADAFARAAAQGAATRLPTGIVELSINRLYVAVTRSRRAFFSIDEDVPHRTWALDGVASALDRVEDAAELVRVTSEEFAEARSDQWADAARTFERVGSWEQAAECWMLADEALRAARLWEDHGRLQLAADAWEKGGATVDAARCRAQLAEQEKIWRAAADLWGIAGDVDRRAVALARAALAEGDLVQSATLFEQAGMREEAVDVWERAGIWEEALRVADVEGRADWRARLLDRLKRHGEAAEAWLRADRPLPALDAAVLANDREFVLVALEKLLPAPKQEGEPEEASAAEAPRVTGERQRERERRVRGMLEERRKTLPAYARRVVAERYGDRVMHAEALYDDGDRMAAMQTIGDLEKSGRADDLRWALRLQWRWAKAGDRGIDPTVIAHQALRAEVRFAIDGQGDKEELARAERWASTVGLPVARPEDVIRLAGTYREVCKDTGRDRERLKEEAKKNTHPVAQGIAQALAGDVAGARTLWKAEGLSFLANANPMRVDEHFPLLRREYIRGSSLADDARRRLRENLGTLYKVCKGRNASLVDAMMAELDGDPGRAWNVLREKDKDLAPVRHETARQRRHRIERLLVTGAALAPAEVDKAILTARAYVASDERDKLSAAALAVWQALDASKEDLPKALDGLAKEHRGEVSLPLGFELVEQARTNAHGMAAIGLTWAKLGEAAAEKSPVGAPFRVLLQRVLKGETTSAASGDEGWYFLPRLNHEDELVRELVDTILPRFPKGWTPALEERWRRILDAYRVVSGDPAVARVVGAYEGLMQGERLVAKEELLSMGLERLARGIE